MQGEEQEELGVEWSGKQEGNCGKRCEGESRKGSWIFNGWSKLEGRIRVK